MKCPKCSLITSDSKDHCPRCSHDFSAKKQELGLTPTPLRPKAKPEKLILKNPQKSTRAKIAPPLPTPAPVGENLASMTTHEMPTPTAELSLAANEMDLTASDELTLPFPQISDADEIDSAGQNYSEVSSSFDINNSLDELSDTLLTNIMDSTNTVEALADSVEKGVTINNIGDSKLDETETRAATNSPSPTILDFSGDEDSFDAQLNELIGDEEITIAGLSCKNTESNTFIQDDTDPIHFTIEIEESDNEEMEGSDPDDRLQAIVAKVKKHDCSLAEELLLLYSDLPEIPVEDNCDFVAELEVSEFENDNRDELVIEKNDSSSELWSAAEVELRAELIDTFEIPAAELLALPDENLMQMLFDLAATEISAGKIGYEKSPVMPTSIVRQVPNEELEHAFDRFEIAEAVQAVRNQEAENAIDEFEDFSVGSDFKFPVHVLRRSAAIAIDSACTLLATVAFLCAGIIPIDKLISRLAFEEFTFAMLTPYSRSIAVTFFVTWALLNFIGLLIWSSTIGGQSMKLEVVNRSGEPLGADEIMRRIGGMLLTFLSCGFGLLPIVRPSGRALHDRISHTHVKIKDSSP